ncbi:MAG: hypothetical protein ACLFR5_06230 [Halobacteriales archaeon]
MSKETEEKAKDDDRRTSSALVRPSNVLVDSDSPSPLPSAERGDGNETAFVVVSLLSKTDRRIEALEEANGEPADSVHVVCVEGRADNGYDTLRTVNSPGDLTGLSMRIGEVLSELHEDDVYLYFDDVTSLLQYTDLNTAYRFLNVLTGRIDAADAVGYFAVTPDAHDERTLNTLRNLFDETVGEFS